MMKACNQTTLAALYCALSLLPASATERYFTYTYEPETMPRGASEYEQWVTLAAGRDAAVGQENYRRWVFREELEYGVTDNYTVSFYLNESLENYYNNFSHQNVSDLQFVGVSLENRYMVLNPADHAVGLALYLEPLIGGSQAEIEERIILGQRRGDWKWALNLTQATEWKDDFRTLEGEVEVSLGITRHFGPRWSVGLEARDNNELPDYQIWENTALYVGPVATYAEERWWATLSVMPQVYGANFQDNPDGNSHLDLEGHERWNVRLIFGFSF